MRGPDGTLCIPSGPFVLFTVKIAYTIKGLLIIILTKWQNTIRKCLFFLLKKYKIDSKVEKSGS